MKSVTRPHIQNRNRKPAGTVVVLSLRTAVLAAVACWGAALAQTPVTSTAVVRHVAGTVRMSGASHDSIGTADSTGREASVKAGDLPESGRTFITGPDGSLTLRFHPDLMTVELSSSARATIDFGEADSGAVRRVAIHAGRAVGRVTPGASLAFEDSHATAFVRAGRVAYAAGEEAATVLVMEGEARVFNRNTGATDLVTRGGKAVAGRAGTVVTRAAAEDMAAAGLRQNILEVDFWNPATEEYRTLEIEYETHPRAR